MEDRQIILLLREDPSEGLRKAIEKYGGLVKTVVSRVLPYHAEDVEECVADTFVNIWKTAGRIDPDTGTFKGLLLCTARNTAINRYHQLRRRQVISLDTVDLVSDEDIAMTVISGEACRELQRLILEMGSPDKEIFFRKYFLFEKVREIAARLSLDEVQVKNRLYRGRQRLSKKLEERGVSYEAI